VKFAVLRVQYLIPVSIKLNLFDFILVVTCGQTDPNRFLDNLKWRLPCWHPRGNEKISG